MNAQQSIYDRIHSVAFYLFWSLLLVALVLNKQDAFSQCPDSLQHEDQISENFESLDYHCYMLMRDTLILTDWDLNRSGQVNTAEHSRILTHYGPNHQIGSMEFGSFLAQFESSPDSLDCPNLCYFSVNTIQSSGVTLKVPDLYTDSIFDYRPGEIFTSDFEDAIIQYSQADEPESWPDCLTSEILCMRTFKLLLFVQDPDGPFTIVEQYFYLR